MKNELLPQGAEVCESGVRYRIWAPVSKSADVEIFDESGSAPKRSLRLALDASGYFHGIDDQGGAGDLYKFRLDNGQSYPDPASRFQPQGVHGPSMVVDPRGFKWTDANRDRVPFRDLVIYELHIGTFTQEGTFLSAIEKLQHIRDLGATAIEIMPIADFPGDRNWGYDGVLLYAPAHAYGHPNDLRKLVDAAHRLGLAVILDVVYNHFGPDGNYLASYIGDYLDEKRKTPWGGSIRYDDPNFRPLRALVVSNPLYWMEEFHVDGFRLDAVHAIMDESPRHILEEITTAIHEHGGFAIAEDSRNDSRLVLPAEENGLGFDGVWADDFHHTVRVSNTHEEEGYLGDFAGSLSEIVETLRNGWFYRGQYSPRREGKRGTECRHVPPERFIHCISNHDQVGNRAFGDRVSHSISRESYLASSALLCLSPYTPMLFMGQEWAASTPFLFFTDHNEELGKLVTAGRREEFKDFEAFRDHQSITKIPDPQSGKTFQDSKLVWDELRDGKKGGTLELYQACLALRNSDPAFRPTSREIWHVEELEIGIGALRIKGRENDWLILFDLAGGHRGSLADEWICKPRPGQAWSLVLSTNEKRFGGSGRSGVDLPTLGANFETAELAVLKS